MKTITVSGILAVVIAAVGYMAITSGATQAQTQEDWGPVWAADGQLVLPKGYREWVYLGSPLTPNALNDGAAGFPEYHNVYIQPQAFRAYRETGTFPEGTIMLKELQLAQEGQEDDGSRYEVSGRGYFPGAFNGIDISVKDSARFPEGQGWGYFNFGHHAPPYAETAAAAPVSACAQCHIDSADEDMVFLRFYAPLTD